jgi:hypothetical protein
VRTVQPDLTHLIDQLNCVRGLEILKRQLVQRSGRCNPRFLILEDVTVHSVHPVASERMKGQLLDVSKNGLKLRTADGIPPGSEILVMVRNLIVVGEVRYVRPAASTFDHGIAVKQVLGYSPDPNSKVSEPPYKRIEVE